MSDGRRQRGGRVDVDAIARQVAAERARRRFDERVEADARDERGAARLREVQRRLAVPAAPLLEGRLLAAMLCEREVLELCADVEADDFTALKHGIVFRALRNLQARGEWRAADCAESLAALGAELARTDARDEKHERDSVDDLYITELLARHLWETYGPPHAPIAAWVGHDARQLRLLAERRRSL